MLWYVILAMFGFVAVWIGLVKFRLDTDYTVKERGGIFFAILERYDDVVVEVYASATAVIAVMVVATVSGKQLMEFADRHLADSHPLWIVVGAPLLLLLILISYGFLMVFLVKVGAYISFRKINQIRNTKCENLLLYLRTGVDVDGRSERMVMRHTARG